MTPDELLAMPPEAVWKEVWRQLARAARDPRHPFRLPSLATACPERGVRVRTLVLREVEAEEPALTFHSDRRAGKVAGLGLDPRASWCFYDPRRRVQVRAETRVQVHVVDARARAAWSELGTSARRVYAARAAPGSGLEIREPHPGAPADAAEDEWSHFACAVCRVEQLDWLLLHRSGHRRIGFRPDGSGVWQGTPRVP